MENEIVKVDVIFRKEKDGSILAVFPYELYNWKGNPTCYAHVGQHSECEWGYVLAKTKPAQETEYADLRRELESIGYELKVIKQRFYPKYLRAYYEIKEKQNENN